MSLSFTDCILLVPIKARWFHLVPAQKTVKKTNKKTKEKHSNTIKFNNLLQNDCCF